MKNYIDESFNNIITFIKERNFEKMVDIIKNNFNYYYNINPSKFMNITKFYNDHKLWGEIDIHNNNFELIERNAFCLINHCDDFIWVYNILDDYRSKKILINVLLYWIMFNDKKISELKDDFYQQYFDLDLIKCDTNEVFVDIGSYTGDTMINYIKTFGKDCYKKIFCYEIVPANIDYIKKNIKSFNLKNIIVKEKGATNKKGKMFIDSDDVSSIKKLSDNGEIEVDIVKIDQDIKGSITFVKMDIEGGEYEALLGLKNKIKKYKPKLAISVYHNNDHLWQIPRLIHELNPEYKFYLRYYGGPILPTEYILYAI